MMRWRDRTYEWKWWFALWPQKMGDDVIWLEWFQYCPHPHYSWMYYVRSREEAEETLQDRTQ
jgi:hypothetical protein